MRFILIVLMAFSLAGCASMNPFSGISNPPKEPRKIASYLQTEKQVPLKVGITPDGKEVIAYSTERTYTASSSEDKVKLTFLQRIGNWIGGLSIMAIVFIVLSLAFFGGTPILWAVKKYYSIKVALTKVVDGVEKMSEEDKARLKENLSKSMDTKDKTLIKKIKTEI